MSLHRPYHLSLILAALVLAGCAKSPPPESPAAEAAPAMPAEPAAAPAATAPDTATTLTANQWQLKSATDAAGQSIAAFFPSPEKPLGLLFAEGRINVTGSCNRMSAGYQLLDSAQLQATPGPTTMMACPPPLGDADAAIAGFLNGTLQVAIEGDSGAPQLRLAATDGRALVFGGTPTPETRFGGPGTRAFLEVSPKPCEAPASASPPCLMVRDRNFDEQGLESGTPGEWRALPAGIEGFTPAAGEQQVVRVKRFEQADAAGGAPTEHFVFDMVVQSTTIR
jgi:heat shock protein HslJ